MVRSKCPIFNRESRLTKKQDSMAHSREEKISQHKIVPEKDLMTDLLDRDLKIAVFRLLKELQEDTGKDKKIMYEQNRNINKVIENVKRSQNEILELKIS